MGLILLLALMALQPGQDDGPVVTATQVQACTLGGQPVVCPPESEHPPVRQPTVEEIAERERNEARTEAWLADFRARHAPDWKLDPQGWLTFQCKDAAPDALSQCQSNARMQLTQLRAAQIDARPVADPLPSPNRDDGVSFSVGPTEDTQRSSPRSQGNCDAPASGETNAAFVERCPAGGGPRRN